jgi:hypothetical protein
MTTRFEFGYGDGDIFRRRMEAQDEMFRQVAREQEDLPEEDQERLGYASDYYGFRGAGRRAGTAPEEGGSSRRGRRGRQRQSRPRRQP